MKHTQTAEAHAPGLRPHGGIITRERSRPLVAVVDDDPVFIAFVGDLLADEGIATRGLRNPVTAHAALMALQPDVIVLDVRLGGRVSGWDLYAALQADPRTAGIPTIVCSADAAMLAQGTDARDAHSVERLSKPFALDDLLTKVWAPLANRHVPVGARHTQWAKPSLPRKPTLLPTRTLIYAGVVRLADRDAHHRAMRSTADAERFRNAARRLLRRGLTSV